MAQTFRQTHGHGDSMTNLAQWGRVGENAQKYKGSIVKVPVPFWRIIKKESGIFWKSTRKVPGMYWKSTRTELGIYWECIRKVPEKYPESTGRGLDK